MPKQDYTFPSNPTGGRTKHASSETQAADSPSRPDIPQLEPSIRGIAENAGFDSNAIEGEALIRKSQSDDNNEGMLRDGDNSKSLGDLPDYNKNLMDQAFQGRDERPGR